MDQWSQEGLLYFGAWLVIYFTLFFYKRRKGFGRHRGVGYWSARVGKESSRWSSKGGGWSGSGDGFSGGGSMGKW